MADRTVRTSLHLCARIGGALLISYVIPLNGRSVASQQAPAPSQAPSIHVQSSLVLVDVSTQDPKSGLPVRDFKRENFRVFDNGHETPITTFDAGALGETRPAIVWLVVICNEQGKIGGSANYAGKERSFGLLSTIWTSMTWWESLTGVTMAKPNSTCGPP